MKPASEGGAPGTRPEGVQDEREAAAHVREMFGHLLQNILGPSMLSRPRVTESRASETHLSIFFIVLLAKHGDQVQFDFGGFYKQRQSSRFQAARK